MNMSDELASATIQVGVQTIGAGVNSAEKIVDVIAKLLKAISDRIKEERADDVTSTDLTDIGSGEVSLNELRANARANGDSLVMSENGFTKDDAQTLAQKARDYGIPISFINENSRDNVYVQVRSSDLPIFKNMCTEMMKEKLAEKPQSLGNFKVNEWEIPFITNELNKHDLSAQFGVTKDGQHLCIYEKADEKAIMIARDEFIRKCDEVNTSLSFSKDEEDIITISNKNTEKSVSFDASMSQDELCEHIKNTFGFDDNKARIACAKLGEEMLSGDAKSKFFSSDPVKEFSKIETNISLEGESILVKQFTCIRATPKLDSVPRLIFHDKNGDFAVLDPEKMDRETMTEILKNQLHIGDSETINAVIDKAERVTDFYIRQDEKNLTHEHEGISITIERNSQSKFMVTSNFENGGSQQLILSFSDKKSAVQELAELYKNQGISEHTAKSLAKDIVKKAAAQSAEKVVQIAELQSKNIPEMIQPRGRVR